MNYKKEHLLKLLEIIDDICEYKENDWFLAKILEKKKNKDITNKIFLHTLDIKEVLKINFNTSINYNYLRENKELYNRLVIDNYRMENIYKNIADNDLNRRVEFITNAFYQIENLINFYYYEYFETIDIVLSFIETNTKSKHNDLSKDFSFKRNPLVKYSTINDISFNHKINAFTSFYNLEKSISIGISSIRKIRNDGVHRCNALIKNNENSYISSFLSDNPYEKVRIILREINNLIKNIKNQNVSKKN